MSLRSPAAAEIALTLALSHQNGEGIFESHIALARFAGEGKGEGSVLTGLRGFKGFKTISS